MLVFNNKINQLSILALFFIIISSAVQANNIKNSAVVFMYHKFGISKYPTTNITLDQFDKHLDEFSKPEYNVMALDYILDTIINDLTPLMGSVKINVVKQKWAANFIAYIGSPTIYSTSIEPKTAPYIRYSNAMFWVYWSGRKHINKGSMWIDPTFSEKQLKHVLREELTQSLGLMNDSFKYTNSIFYQGGSRVTSYSDIDKQIIKILYSNRISPGMSKGAVKQTIQYYDLTK